MRARPPAYTVQGELQRQGNVVTGWCWSPERPAERLIVELRVGGALVASVVAARLRLDLARDGVCDGCHAFTIALPLPMPAGAVVEACEYGTGHVFGRLTAGGGQPLAAMASRIDDISAAVCRLQDGLADATKAAPLRHVASRAACALLRSSPEALPACRVPSVSNPRSSLILDAGGSEATIAACIARLSPLLRHHECDLVVISQGALAIDGVTMVGAGERQGDADAWRAAAHVARGGRLLFLHAADVTARGVAELLKARTDRTILGNAALTAARRAGLRWQVPELQPLGSASGLALMVDRHSLDQVGGFDPGMDDGRLLHVVDLGLRLLQSGFDLASSGTWGSHSPGPVEPSARMAFATRWRALQ